RVVDLTEQELGADRDDLGPHGEDGAADPTKVRDHGSPAVPGTPRSRPFKVTVTAPPSLVERMSRSEAAKELDSPGPSETVFGWPPSLCAVTSTPAVASTVTATAVAGVGPVNGAVAGGVAARRARRPRPAPPPPPP